MPKPADGGYVSRRYLQRIAQIAAETNRLLDTLTRQSLLQEPYVALANKTEAQRQLERIAKLATEAQLNLPPSQRSEDI